MKLGAVPDPTLDDILAKVSRSFYLSLAILPRAVRTQLSVAYLVARAADTIADTRAVRPERRLELLRRLQSEVQGGDERSALVLGDDVVREIGSVSGGASDSERLLLTRLAECLGGLRGFETGDRERTQRVLETLITGMERDLRRFPSPEAGRPYTGEPIALGTLDELDEHCYFAAGCVGEYWTTMMAAHVSSLRRLGRPDFVARGVRLGKALQLVNVVRDAARDLSEGRAYVPRELLDGNALSVGDLVDPARRARARAALATLHRLCLEHVDAAFPYVLAIPRRELRLRLATTWPLWIGLATLARLRDAADPLDPSAPIKITRREVYAIIAESTATAASDRLLSAAHARRRRAAAI
jgi:farnesyl-diphosphate farnesyltransferase